MYLDVKWLSEVLTFSVKIFRCSNSDFESLIDVYSYETINSFEFCGIKSLDDFLSHPTIPPYTVLKNALINKKLIYHL